MDETKPVDSVDEQKLLHHSMKAIAVRQAMTEIIGEQRDEIIRRARAKLVAMGVPLDAQDIAAMHGAVGGANEPA